MKRSKKGQEAMEFLMTYGWAILVVLLAIAALAYFGVLNPERYLPVTEGPDFVCSNLEKDSIDGVRVYPAVITSKYVVEESLGLQVTDIDGDSSVATQFDTEGVMCGIDTSACNSMWCLQVQMLVPINYTEWNKWMEE